jgi:hypothetical protein
MARCENKVGQMVPKGYDYKEVFLRCGSTSLQGDPLECGECRKKRTQANRPPPGYCRHGTFINTAHDIPCGRCELEA